MEQSETLSDVLGASPFTNPVSPPPSQATDVKAEPAAPATPSVATESKPEPETVKAEKPRDDKGRFAKSESQDSKPEPEAKPEPTAPIAALQDERRKRQELEAKLRELTAKQEEKPKTDFFHDPEKAFQERTQSALNPLQEKFFRMSMRVAEQLHADDFSVAAESFSKAIEQDPRLLVEWRNADDPGEYAYRVGMQFKELSDVGGDLRAYRQKIEGGVKGQLDEAQKQIAALRAELDTIKKTREEVSQVSESLNSQASRSAALADTDPDDITTLVRFGTHKTG